MEDKLPKRKSMRLKQHNYSEGGAYFVTICTKDRARILSKVVKLSDESRGDIFKVELSDIGEIVERQLLSSESIPGVKIDRYVIMPDHLHALILLNPKEYSLKANDAQMMSSPANEILPRVISSFKRLCGRVIGENIFQRGYMDHIVRDKEDYETRVKYIFENPIKWFYEKLDAIR